MLIEIDTNNPQLLEGLDVLLQLGLISDAQAKQLCQQYLSVPLPEPVRKAVIEPVTSKTPVLRATEEFAPEPEEQQLARSPNLATQLLQSLKAELSVRWLLFLGLFMVVLSSGLLAASQWEKFPAAVQYLVLLAYTLGFWGAAILTGKAAGLRLTAQSLRIVTLLLVPVNFWAMDALGLWGNFLGWLTVAIASIILSAIAVNLYRKHRQARGNVEIYPSSKWQWLPLINLLGLSYLQSGWGLPGFPLLAVYLGVISTAFTTFSRQRNSANNYQFFTGIAIIVYALAILLMRAVFIAGVALPQIGLAFGISGWILIKSSPRISPENTKENPEWFLLQNRLGASLLFLGWLVSVATQPWQAFLVSGIGLSVLTERLFLYWKKWDLAAIFIIGWQAYSSIGRLIPPEVKRLAISMGIQMASAENAPGTLFSLTWLPYLIFMVWVTDWLYYRQKKELARFGEWMALGFGAFLTVLGLLNPWMRSLNLLASTIILAIVTYRRKPNRISLVYLTHITGLLSICAWIDLLFPNLTVGIWAAILLGIAIVEWGLFSIYPQQLLLPNILPNLKQTSLIYPLHPLLNQQQNWSVKPRNAWAGKFFESDDKKRYPLPNLFAESGWYLGFVVAGIAYLLLKSNLNNSLGYCPNFSCQFAYEWATIWLVIPLALTLVARTKTSKKQTAGWSSVIALLIAQTLTIYQPETRLIGFGVATALMLVNTRALQDRIAATITVGFGLFFLRDGLSQTVPALSSLSAEGWLVANAVTLTCVWLLRATIIWRNTRLAPIYAPALDGWAIALCCYQLLAFMHNVFVREISNYVVSRTLLTPIATCLTMAATTFRACQPPRNVRSAWLNTIVLLVAQLPTIMLPGVRLIALAVATVLIFVNSLYVQDVVAAAIAIGFGLSYLALQLGQGVLGFPPVVDDGWFVVIAIAAFGLWLLRSALLRSPLTIFDVYAKATDRWAIALCGLELIVLTGHSLAVYQGASPPSITAIVAAAIILAAIAYRQPVTNAAAVYSFGWGLELLIAEVLSFAAESAIYLAIANIILGLIAQILGDWWQRKTGIENIPKSWQMMPLCYGIFGTFLRADTFENWTGLTTLGLALIFIGVGRRQTPFKPLVYLGIVGISLAASEILFYQVLPLPTGEKLIAFAALGASIVYAYRLLSPWLIDYFRIAESEIKNISHFHWAASSLILMLATGYPITSSKFVGLATGIFLSRYAVMQGRDNPNSRKAEIWVYLGVLEAAGITLYLLNLLDLTQIFLPWFGAIATLVSYSIYFLPWGSLGWSIKPWRRVAFALPILGLSATRLGMGFEIDNGWYVSVAIAAAFYILMAKVNRQIRFSYISVGLIDWAIAIYLLQIDSHINALFYATPPGLSLLYFAQLDPALKQPESRETRHLLRIIGSGIICITALFNHEWTGIIPGLISIVSIFLGLGLRVRAFLYVGTATFLINAFIQLVILSSIYSFLKWAIGLIVGIIFIWIAANFETRREQIAALLQNWIAELEAWE